MESDSLSIFHALTGLSPSPSLVDSVVQGLLEFCSEFRKVSFSHIRRQGNTPSHLLAKHVKSIVDFSTEMEENSYFLE